MNGLIAAAEEYLNAGLSIIALSGKLPNGKVHKHGLNEPLVGPVATPEDGALVAGVFNHPDTTGIGIVLGEGLCVVDIDGEVGARAFLEMVPEGWADTAVASTGRGLHLYYVRVLPTRTTKLSDKLDLKGVGGYVAAPPSRHPSGARYEWLDPLVVDGRLNVGLLPDGVEDFLRTKEAMLDTKVRRTPAEMFAMDPSTTPWTWTRVPVDVNLSGLVDSVTNAKEGERNNMLNWAAYRAREDGVSYEDALVALGTAAADAGLEAQEIRQTIRSAYRGHR